MSAQQLPPDRLLRERYRIVERVGDGATGIVYSAEDLRTRQRVAIKQLVVSSPLELIGFSREAAILASLGHPSLPTANEYFVESGQPLLVMTWIPGPDLGQMLVARSDSFGARTVIQWADQLLDGLVYLHMLGIVHHDIKPRNIKLDSTGRAVLVDFGLAQRQSRACSGGPAGYTAAYAPPEQIRGEATDGRSDLYALAATMYELLARRMPPPALRRVAHIRAGQPDPLVSLDSCEPSIPASLAALVGQTLSLEPAQRPRNARAMQLALAAIPLGTHACAVRAPTIRRPQARAARDLVTTPR